MSDAYGQPQAPALAPRRIRGINGIGLATLIRKETGRFLNVYTQTLLAPVITALLFYAIFAIAFGHAGETIGDVPYLQFLAPGLIMMSMAQNAFANTSSSLIISKVQGNIVDVLMPPLSPAELLAGYVIGGVIRGLLVGVVTFAAIAALVPLGVHSFVHVFLFAVLGCLMLSTLGVAGGIWSQKFDHIAAVTNFIVTPLTFLSGTFYSIEKLPGAWGVLAHYNPFFHMIDGFRYGFTGHADGSLGIALAVLTAVNIALILFCHGLLKSGYRIKS